MTEHEDDLARTRPMNYFWKCLRCGLKGNFRWRCDHCGAWKGTPPLRVTGLR